VSPTLLAALQGAERQTNRDRAFSRRWYLKTGVSLGQARYYSARCAWPSALDLVRLNGYRCYS
jgi:hypothetical protein